MRRTSGWTDVYASLAGALLAAAVTGWSAVSTHGIPAVTVLAVALGVALVALLLDGYGGIVVGLVGAAVLLGGYVVDGAITRPLSWIAVVAGMVVLGSLTGSVGDRLRRLVRRSADGGHGTVTVTRGSTGLLARADGAAVLAAELDRARLHSRPLTVATVSVELTGSALAELSDDDARRARRAVARAVQSNVRATDVPFALDESGERFAVVLPETTPDGARAVLGTVLLAAGEATFADRTRDVRRPVAEVARLELRTLDAAEAPEPALPDQTVPGEALALLRRVGAGERA